jgi:hypothetical protein
MPAFINDGYTQTANIDEKPGVHEAVTIKFRPLTATERIVHFDGDEKKSPAARAEKHAKMLASHIVEWDICDDGKSVEINAANVGRLTFDLFFRLVDIVAVAEMGDDAKNSKPASP